MLGTRALCQQHSNNIVQCFGFWFGSLVVSGKIVTSCLVKQFSLAFDKAV